MKIAKLLAVLGVIAMTFALANGFVNGDIAAEGGQLLGMPWGVVSLVDLYTGFTLFSIWVAYREGSLWRAAAWIVGLMVLGFWLGAVYMLFAFYGSGNDWREFWLGAHA